MCFAKRVHEICFTERVIYSADWFRLLRIWFIEWDLEFQQFRKTVKSVCRFLLFFPLNYIEWYIYRYMYLGFHCWERLCVIASEACVSTSPTGRRNVTDGWRHDQERIKAHPEWPALASVPQQALCVKLCVLFIVVCPDLVEYTKHLL